MEIARTPEMKPDRDGGKRWPPGRRRAPSPPRKNARADAADEPPPPADQAPAETAGPPSAPAQHVDVTV